MHQIKLRPDPLAAVGNLLIFEGEGRKGKGEWRKGRRRKGKRNGRGEGGEGSLDPQSLSQIDAPGTKIHRYFLMYMLVMLLV